MARDDLELWLEAAPGYAVPPECYAALRSVDAKVPASTTRCLPNEASRLNGKVTAGDQVVVDIFQKVGSITLGCLQSGALEEVAVAWPGLLDLRLRVTALVAVDLATATATAAAAPPPQPESPFGFVSPLHQLGLENNMEGDIALVKEAPGEPANVLPAWSPLHTAGPAPMVDIVEPVKVVFAEAPTSPFAVEARSGVPSPSPVEERPTKLFRPSPISPRRDEEQPKMYKPIVLNNCDQIIPNLYLGGVAAASDTQSLVQQGIRAVCCCCRELEFPSKEFSKELEYYRVDVEDISREPIELYFPEATEFIHSWISREQPVLVHCRAGVSRSASVVIAYLIAYQNYSLHDAFFLVRSHRSVVTPNVGFMEKLGEYEEEKRGMEPTIEINKYLAWYQTPERAAVPDLKPD